MLMASLDTTRPAAMEQLRVLGEQAGIATLPIMAGQGPLDIAKRAMASAKVGGYDVVILDTAGRQHVDEELMAEIASIKALVNPHETLLVADALTGTRGEEAITRDAVRAALADVELLSDLHASVDYRRRAAASLAVRAVTDAYRAAEGAHAR